MATISQRSFSGGEIAPALQARVDTSKYMTGARTLRNFMVMRHGGVTNRPGFRFRAEGKFPGKTSVLKEFTVTNGSKFMLEFGDYHLRVFKNREHVYASTLAITGITLGAVTTITIPNHGYSIQDEVHLSGILGTTELNGRSFFTWGVTTNTFEIRTKDDGFGTDLNSTGFGAYVSGGTSKKVFELATVYPVSVMKDMKFSPLGNKLTLTHKDYPPADLVYQFDDIWSIDNGSFVPNVDPPTGFTVTGGPAGTKTHSYVVTAVSAKDGEESYTSEEKSVTAGTPTPDAPITLNWSSPTGILEFNVYKKVNGVFGFLGIAGPRPAIGGPKNGGFLDIGVTPNTSDGPPTRIVPFTPPSDDTLPNYDPFEAFSTEYYPSNIGYYQQRRVYMATGKEPDGVWLSRVGKYYNFSASMPAKDDDSIHFRLAGEGRNKIKHAVNLGNLILLTEDGEWVVGQAGSAITPYEINARQHSYNGSADVSPIIMGGNMLYIQANGSIVRDFGFDYQVDGYRGNDLTIFSAHLFDGHTFTSWAYQQTPHSIVWMVRDDGALIALTYIREQEILAWHRHDTDGVVEHIASISENNENTIYITVKRTVDGVEKRFIETLEPRVGNDIVDSVFMDSVMSYDGRVDSPNELYLYSSDYGYESLTQLGSPGVNRFTPQDIGKGIHLTGPSGHIVRLVITQYDTPTLVHGTVDQDIPIDMRSKPVSNWAWATNEVTGLWHLEGKEVSILADGFVLASPNNSDYDKFTVTDGKVSLGLYASVVHVGLPYISDLETLDIDTVAGETLVDKEKIVHRISLHLDKTRGLWLGAKPPSDDTVNPLEGLIELEQRSTENYDSPIALQDGILSQNILPEWNSNGRVFIRQVDPLPASILGVSPNVSAPFKKRSV